MGNAEDLSVLIVFPAVWYRIAVPAHVFVQLKVGSMQTGGLSSWALEPPYLEGVEARTG